MTIAYSAELVMLCLEEFLTNDQAADASKPKGWNDELIALRARLGLPPYVDASPPPAHPLPPVRQFETWRYAAADADLFPYASLDLRSVGVGVPGPQGTMRDHVFDLVLVVLDADVQDDPSAVADPNGWAGDRVTFRAAWRYYNALLGLFKRVPSAAAGVLPGRTGYTLNNGGTHAARRIVRATLGPARRLSDRRLKGRPNIALTTQVGVRVLEDW
jgi:hypothetical protein